LINVVRIIIRIQSWYSVGEILSLELRIGITFLKFATFYA